MSDSNKQTVHLSPWLGGSIITLLVLQVGLLWVHGNMLQRQHEAILDLREDVQSLAETLEDQGEADASPEAYAVPARLGLARHRRARLARVAYLQHEHEPEDDAALGKELDASQQSGAQAVIKAREIQAKLSISENIRKADEKAAVAAEGRKMRPWLWAGAALAVLAMLARSWMRKRG